MPWFRQWWGVVLITLFLAAALLAVVMAILIGYYFWEIKQGRGEALKMDFAKQFTAIQGRSAAAQIATRADLEIPGRPYLGAASSSLVVVEFIDYKCPNCLLAEPILNNVINKYGQKIKLIIRDFPVESTHPGATALAEVAACAGVEGRYKVVHDWLYKNQNNLPAYLGQAELDTLSSETGLDLQKLKACQSNTNSEAVRNVRSDYFDGLKFGVRGTPTFYINGVKVEGVISAEGWASIIESQSRAD
ncbi:MAG: DsbA family protein [Candidatus Magasanikbacteria bacterium]|nr:DsbA family protein [Candidatus Magasanikbacteria bacterium]